MPLPSLNRRAILHRLGIAALLGGMPRVGIGAPAPGLIPRTQLFENRGSRQVRVSIDGSQLAWLVPGSGGTQLWTAPTAAPDRGRLLAAVIGARVSAPRWTYDGRLLLERDESGSEDPHILAIDPGTGQVRDLTPEAGVRSTIVALSRARPGEVLIATNRRDRHAVDLCSLNLVTGALGTIARDTGSGTLVDDQFRPRVGSRIRSDGSRLILRADADGRWIDWFSFAPEDARVSGHIAINAAGTMALFKDSRGRDTAALVRIDLASGERQLLAAHPAADIDDVVVDRDTGEPLFCTAGAERPEILVIDPALEADIAALTGWSPDEWGIAGPALGDRFWSVGVGSGHRPVTGYLYDRAERRLTKLYDSSPGLAGTALAALRPVTLQARDGLALVSYLTLPVGSDGARPGTPDSPLPLVLLVHGGPWQRDGSGFNVEHQWLANRGYAVLSVNFRGSRGFGKAFLAAGNQEWGRRMDDDLQDAIAWAIRQRIADPARIAIMGGSYGGYAVVAGMARSPGLYACGIDLYGEVELETLLRTTPPYWGRTELYRAMGDPDTEAGRAWLRDRSPLYQADRIAKPLLVAQGANDVRVRRDQSDRLVAALTARGVPVVYLVYGNEGHGFARAATLTSFHAAAEAFLARYLGGRAEPIAAGELERASVQVVVGGELLGR